MPTVEGEGGPPRAQSTTSPEQSAGEEAATRTGEREPADLPDDTFCVPASYAQQRLWFLDQLEPGSAAYSMSLAVRLTGSLSVPALAEAVRATVRRHESLRTTFADLDQDGACQQLIWADGTVELELHDLSTGADPAAEVRSLAAATEEVPFDLRQGPLLFVRLARLGPAEHVLLARMHHIISDGWSLGVFARDVAAYYRASLEATPVELPELAIQYADYSVWQREAIDGDLLAGELQHWREELDGAPGQLELPLDRPRVDRPSGRGGALLTRRWPRELVEALRKLARAERATLFMVLLAGYAATLSRFGAGDDVVVGTPVAGRPRPELDDLIGFFVNTLPVRVRLEPSARFAELVGVARESSMRALEHQALPFERLVEALHPERSLTNSPIVQTLLVLQNAPSTAAAWPGLTVEPFDGGPAARTAKFDLSLFGYELGEELQLELEYDSDLFDAGTVGRLLDHLRELLSAAVRNPELPLSELAVPTPTPAAPVRVPELTIDELFRAQAGRTPDAPALERDGRVVSFAELDRRVQELATGLRNSGALAGAAEPIVALCLPRTFDLVAAMLAVLRAGAAYLPLDPAYPAERLATMLADSGAVLLLTTSALAAAVSATDVRRLRLDDLRWTVPAAEPEPGGPAGRADRLAYVLYTSGSTGRPKGVQLTHANAVAMLHWAAAAFGEADRARLLATTSVCFDLSVFEIFLPLCFGGTVVLADDVLSAVASRVPVTLVNTVPSALAQVLLGDALPPGARSICLAGEALPGRLVNEAYAQPGVLAVHNLYGPTEATTYSTHAVLPAGDERPPPIGRPISGTSAYLLDRGLRPVPAGAPGELFLGGLGVARGYLGRPGLTAERFVPDPFSDVAGARMYRTGDLARLRPDDTLDYRGRLDHQVKLRGFRIELGEIEAALREHPAVREAVVVVDESSSAGPRLAAYVASARAAEPASAAESAGAAGAAADLRAQLAEQCARRLPGFMVPTGYVVLPELPRTPNGKLDRRALPPLSDGDRVGSAGHQPPRDAVERQVARIWSELLDRTDIGIEDNFFALGGHSLLATQVIARLRSAFGLALPLRAVFEAPTLAGLCAHLTAAESRPGEILAIAELREQIESLSPEEVLARLDEG